MDEKHQPDASQAAAGRHMSEEEALSATNESVDEILRDIMREDGTYNEEFNDLFSRYLGGSADEVRAADLSDRTDEDRPRRRVEYEDEADRRPAGGRSTARRISDKLSPEVREIYSDAVYASAQPEFTNEGTVRYPSMGVGESEERVVFDADWEARAKQEAANRDRIRRENMLRGDSAYARSFRFSSGGRAVYNPLVDPLDDSADVPLFKKRQPQAQQKKTAPAQQPEEEAQTEEKEEKKPFFPEGFSANKKISNAVSGKTDIRLGDSSSAAAEDGLADAAVIEAFSGDREKENEFRERWKGEVEEAQRRRERKAAEERRLSAVRRTEELRAERAAKVAAAEKLLTEDEIPLELDNITNKSDFEEIPDRIEPETAIYPPAEKIDQLERSGDRLLVTRRTDADGKPKKPSARARLRRFSREHFPHRGDGAKETARKVIRAVAFVALIGALVYLAVYGVRYLQRIRQTKDFEDQISEMENLTPAQEEDAWRHIRAQYPDVTFPEGMQVKFGSLYAVNQDLVGWLNIENTNISTPLLQTRNNDFYLYHDIYGKSSRYGNPFVHCDCQFGKELSRNTILFGHNTHDGLMFHQLTGYMRPEGYLAAPIVTLDTLYETTKWKIFAVMLTNSTADMDNGNVFQYLYPEFSSDSAFLAKVREIYARSMIHTGVDVEAGDKILTLYTCYQNIFSGGRLVVFARQLREGESEEIDVSKVYYDSTAKFPAAYYGKSKTQSTGTTVAPMNERTPTNAAGETAAAVSGTQPAEATSAGEETAAAAQESASSPPQEETQASSPATTEARAAA